MLLFPNKERSRRRRKIIYIKKENIKEAQSPKNVEFLSWVSFLHMATSIEEISHVVTFIQIIRKGHHHCPR